MFSGYPLLMFIDSRLYIGYNVRLYISKIKSPSPFSVLYVNNKPETSHLDPLTIQKIYVILFLYNYSSKDVSRKKTFFFYIDAFRTYVSSWWVI